MGPSAPDEAARGNDFRGCVRLRARCSHTGRRFRPSRGSPCRGAPPPSPGPLATDDWPFLYLRSRSIPPVVVGSAVLFLLAAASPFPQASRRRAGSQQPLLLPWYRIPARRDPDDRPARASLRYDLARQRDRHRGDPRRSAPRKCARQQDRAPEDVRSLRRSRRLARRRIPRPDEGSSSAPDQARPPARSSFSRSRSSSRPWSSPRPCRGWPTSPALASNLIGGVLGGVLENLSLVLGISALGLLAVAVYACSMPGSRPTAKSVSSGTA